MTPLEYQPVPNWSNSVEIEIEFKTDIFESRSGNETRRALRETPRRRLYYTTTLHSEGLQEFRNLVARYGGESWAVADFTRAEKIELPAGEVSSFPWVTPYWIRTGERLAFVKKGKSQIRQVVSTIDDVVVLDSAVVLEPGTKVAPVMYGRLLDGVKLTRQTNAVGTARISFSEDPATARDPVDPLAEEPWPTYRGKRVFPVRPNWRVEPAEKFEREIDVLDFGYGSVDFWLPQRESKWSADFVSSSRTADVVSAAMDFFCRRKGRREAFYCPTWTADLTLAVPMAAGATEIVVKGASAAKLFAGSLVYRNLALVSRSALFPVGILDAVAEGGNTRLFLDAAVPDAVADVKMISWFLMARFSSDTFKVEWYTNAVGDFDVNVISTVEMFYEIQAAEDRILFNGDYLIMSPYYPPPSAFVLTEVDGEALLVSGDYAG